jgi:hypothetical protein
MKRNSQDKGSSRIDNGVDVKNLPVHGDGTRIDASTGEKSASTTKPTATSITFPCETNSLNLLSVN